ncbi:MAG: zinc ribbon domain-containing protein [Deltaproteobacteria bacterium]|nr:zinc ribbon domain-containing protein [Deltaproteobacteria bacterium]
MKCPKCQFENCEEAKFWFKCGNPLGLRCPNCEKALPAAAILCDECGQNLTSKPFPSISTKPNPTPPNSWPVKFSRTAAPWKGKPFHFTNQKKEGINAIIMFA